MISCVQVGNVHAYRGLKADMADMKTATNGCTFYCMDTSELYMYDGSNNSWVLQSNVNILV